jgi:hypothetical protein
MKKEILKIPVKKEGGTEWHAQPLTSILPKLLPYHALTDFVYFLRHCSR